MLKVGADVGVKAADHRATRQNTGERIDVAASNAPTFKAGKSLRDTVNRCTA